MPSSLSVLRSTPVGSTEPTHTPAASAMIRQYRCHNKLHYSPTGHNGIEYDITEQGTYSTAAWCSRSWMGSRTALPRPPSPPLHHHISHTPSPNSTNTKKTRGHTQHRSLNANNLRERRHPQRNRLNTADRRARHHTHLRPSPKPCRRTTRQIQQIDRNSRRIW